MQQKILMVCTGNTCRSPMAQVIAANLMPEAKVLSAGVFAGPGSPASTEAVHAMSRRDLDLSSHQSQPLTAEMVEQADLIFTMTESHRQAVLNAAPEADGKTQRLDPNSDIQDPYGGPQDLYDQTALQIEAAISQRKKEFSV